MLRRCCCFSLQKGTIIIGWYGLISAILGLIGCIIALCKLDDIVQKIVDNIPENQPVDEGAIRTTLEIALIITIVSTSIGIIVASLLIVGAKKSRPALCLPWLILGAINIVGGLIYSVSQLYSTFSTQEPGAIVLNIIIIVFAYGLGFYLWLVVKSFYTELRRELRGETTALISDSTRSNEGLPTYMRIA
uniref:Putative membrane protein n=1 Tax=Nyssomyia neivai TaxID=330878 RepID=A0A1L8DAA0_9DIPT